jgi:transposase
MKAMSQKQPKSPRPKKAKSAGRKKAPKNYPLIHPDAAGIDIAATADLWAAVGEHASAQPVRCFSPLTRGLRELCVWLKECQVTTVAMEATGIYWLNLYLALREAGLEVVVVNPRYLKNLQRKTDKADCQWLRYLHSVGLLKASFVPAQEILSLRTLSRHRENLVRASAEHVQRMQKALDEMNVHLHHVIDDITGVTGRAILEAILRGERDPKQLSALRHPRVKAPVEKIEQALEGRWNEELLFVLQQEHENWQHLQAQLAACDQKLLASTEKVPVALSEEALAELETKKAAAAPKQCAPTERKPKRSRSQSSKNQPGQADWRRRLHLLLGVDLTLTPGISVLTVLCLLCELGADWRCFPTAAHFASWLGLCPDNRISGGRVLRRSTRTVQNRVRNALKLAAFSLHCSKSHLGDQYRRMRGRLGPAQANTAMAHKLARILWHQMTYKAAYDESFLIELDRQHDQRRKKKLHAQAAKYGFKLVPLDTPAMEQAA